MLAAALIRHTRLAVRPSAVRSFHLCAPAASAEAANNQEPQQPQQHPAEKHTFQAQTRRLLDIVAKSLYQDKEVFIRELVSNSSDALEKAKFYQAKGELSDEAEPLQISLKADKATRTLTIEDTGVGMTKAEMIKNLGTIAHSGTGKFLENLQATDGTKDTTDKLIGQFGVGFYSVFTVADKVAVYSRTGRTKKEASDEDAGELDRRGHCWTSDGQGEYEVAQVDGLRRGTKIVATLKPAAGKDDVVERFLDETFLEEAVKKYSNFVSFPVMVGGKQANTVKALWLMDRNSITEEQHAEFYRFISRDFAPPLYKLQYQTDAPISIRGLFYTPSYAMQERLGFGRYEPGVSVYSRKVLIAAKSKEILPEWLRFIKGVVDSEDLPLNISREVLQDSQLLRRLNRILTSRLIRFFAEQAEENPAQYNDTFWREFGMFISEGTITDATHRADLAKLLRYSPASTDKEVISLADYVKKMTPVYKDKIYYLLCRNRASGLESPYYEMFKNKGVDVLMLSTAYDSYVMESVGKFDGKEIVNIETAVSLDEEEEKKDGDKAKESDGGDKTKAAAAVVSVPDDFLGWFEEAVGKKKVSKVMFSHRLVSTPAIVVNHASGHLRQASVLLAGQEAMPLDAQQVEINGKHPLIQRLHSIRQTSPDHAQVVAQQVFDGALLAAGLLDDPKDMLARLNGIVEKSMQ